MSTPRFTADASLYTSSRTYQRAGSLGRSGACPIHDMGFQTQRSS
jgi:hypothetical protein